MTIAQTCRDNLRTIIASYRKATGASLSAVSKNFYGNAGFLESFLAGRQSMSIGKFEEVVQQLRDEWPEDAQWPPTRAIVIPRPEKFSPGKSPT
jgi:hypothetical protein